MQYSLQKYNQQVVYSLHFMVSVALVTNISHNQLRWAAKVSYQSSQEADWSDGIELLFPFQPKYANANQLRKAEIILIVVLVVVIIIIIIIIIFIIFIIIKIVIIMKMMTGIAIIIIIVIIVLVLLNVQNLHVACHACSVPCKFNVLFYRVLMLSVVFLFL